jgi:DNA-binding transcriptional MerR regulator
MYTITQFARLANVTLKALRHYERIGLLLPARTAAHHRRYAPSDLQRLERVLALRTLGLPLSTVKAVMAGDFQRLAAQRTVLEESRARIDRALQAMDDIERHGNPRDGLDAFIAEASWSRWERMRRQRAAPISRAPDRVSPSRLALFRALQQALTVDSTGATARDLIRQWYGTMPPETAAAVRQRHRWPKGMRTYIASLYDTTTEEWESVVATIESIGR